MRLICLARCHLAHGSIADDNDKEYAQRMLPVLLHLISMKLVGLTRWISLCPWSFEILLDCRSPNLVVCVY